MGCSHRFWFKCISNLCCTQIGSSWVGYIRIQVNLGMLLWFISNTSNHSGHVNIESGHYNVALFLISVLVYGSDSSSRINQDTDKFFQVYKPLPPHLHKFFHKDKGDHPRFEPRTCHREDG